MNNLKKYFSVKSAMFCGFITTLLAAWPDSAFWIWQMLPQELKNYIPEEYTPVIGVIIFLISSAAKVFKEK